jgi:ribonuclease Z
MSKGNVLMLTIVYLGTGAALPSPGRDNTCLVLDDGAELTLIDASGSPLKRMADADLDCRRLARVIITHGHADHSFGFPALLSTLWLAGRTEPLPVYALEETWGVLDRLIGTYWPDGWSHGFPMQRYTLLANDQPFMETPRLSLRAARGQHSVPCVGIRAESAEGRVFAYSSDTTPCDAIVELARDADLLAHESTFPNGHEKLAQQLGHSTAGQAAETALHSGAKRLALVHFTPTPGADLEMLRAGASAFSGPVDTPNDGDRIGLE